MMKSGFAQGIFAFTVITAFITLLGGLMILPQPADAQLFNTFFGILAAGFTSVISYYFGSSSGSREKDETISKLSAPNGTAPPTGGTDGVNRGT